MKIKVTWIPANKIHIFDTENPPTNGIELAIYTAATQKKDVSISKPEGYLLMKFDDLKIQELP